MTIIIIGRFIAKKQNQLTINVIEIFIEYLNPVYVRKSVLNKSFSN